MAAKTNEEFQSDSNRDKLTNMNMIVTVAQPQTPAHLFLPLVEDIIWS